MDRVRAAMSSRGGSQLVGSIVLFAVLVGGGLIYGAGGPPTRDIFVTQMLINAVMVIGLQIYIGNTGVLSFGHMGFAAIAGFTFVILAMSPERKERLIPDAPFGLTDVSVDPLVAVVIALAVTLFVGLIVGLGLARSGAKSGAVAATIITLALLFVVRLRRRRAIARAGHSQAGRRVVVIPCCGGPRQCR
jgi:branched-chain amino acid transport system permease protein